MNWLACFLFTRFAYLCGTSKSFVFNPFWFWFRVQCKQPYVNHFYQSCYAYHSIWIEWIWALFAIIVRHAQRFVALLVYRGTKKLWASKKDPDETTISSVKFSCNDKLVEKKYMALFHYNSPFGIETCIHIYYLLNFLSPCNS